MPTATRLDKLLWCLAAVLAGAAAWSAAAAPGEGVPLPPAAAGLLVLLLIVAFRLGQLQSSPVATAGSAGQDAVMARLQHEQGILRTFFRALPDMAWIKDAEGRYLACNPLFEEFCGQKETEVVGKTDFDFVDHQLANFFRQKDREAMLADRPCVNEEWVTYASDGRRVLLETVKAPIHDAGGRPVAVLGIAHDITAAREAANRIEESRRLLQELTAHREEVREEERRRIARNLHEELGQLLGSLRMGLSVQRVHGNPESFRERLPALLALVDQIIHGLRQAVAELRPNPLNMGILPALEWLVLHFSKDSGIGCDFHGIEGIDLPDERATALFRIVQESLANVARHADAGQAHIFLERDGGDLVLRVDDDGKGFDIFSPRPRTFGLLGMWERSMMLGGKLDIRSEPGRGTEIVLRFPA